MLSDFKYALRQLRKSPGFAAAVIVTLALGIGVNAAVFSMVDGFLLRRVPYPQPQRIAALMTHAEGIGRSGHFYTEEDDSISTSEWRLIRQSVIGLTVAAYEGDTDVGQSGVNLKPARIRAAQCALSMRRRLPPTTLRCWGFGHIWGGCYRTWWCSARAKSASARIELLSRSP